MSDLERRALLGVAGIGAIAALSKAGPLNPPAGPVTPTGRTTDEIFNKIPSGGSGDGRIAIPAGSTISISNPGSYLLTGNVTGTGANGIAISADNVTLDLNGYAVSSAFSSGNGILIASGLKGITVRNGLINGFNIGVQISSTASQVVVEDLLVREAKVVGIQGNNINGRSVRISRCAVYDTGASTTSADGTLTIAGIQVANTGCLIEDCLVSRLLYNGSGSGLLRGIQITGGGVQIIQRCTVVAENIAVSGIGMSLAPSAVRRDNTVLGFATTYAGGIDGGGNV